ncbi:MAG: LysE family transporter [Spirochaetales bacterium]|nr:LysE family transporter [Spirochaetales bacterium]
MIKYSRIWISGLLTGLTLQLAIGPIFFYVLGITLKSGFANGFMASLGAVAADFTFIFLSIFGITRFMTGEKFKRIFSIVGPLLLISFGVFFMISALGKQDNRDAFFGQDWNGLNSFISTFVLTLSSPLSIFFWSGIFTTRALEKNYNSRELVFFGIGAGCATFIFIPAVMLIVSLFRLMIPVMVLKILNSAVALVLIVYGVIRLTKIKASVK